MLLDPSLIARTGRACWERKNNRYWISYSRYADRQAAAFSLAHELFEILAAHADFPTRFLPNRKRYSRTVSPRSSSCRKPRYAPRPRRCGGTG
jgi:hypothetical protein